MKIEGLMPIGSVVLLNGGNHRVMIMGYGQKLVSDPERVYDYVACYYPEGFLSPTETFVFDRDQIERVYHVGYRTDGQMMHVDKIEAALEDLRARQD